MVFSSQSRRRIEPRWCRIAPRRFNAILAAALLLARAALAAAEEAPLRVGYELAAEPMSFARADGRVTGFAVELFRAAAARAGVPLAESAAPWQETLQRFRAGEIDALASVARTAERERFIAFTVPTLALHGAIFVRKGDRPIRSLAELAARRFAVQPESYSHHFLRARGWDRQLELVDDFHAAFQALEDGRCDAVIATRIVGVHVIRKGTLRNIAVSDLALEDYGFRLHIGVQPGAARRLAQLNEGLALVRADGTYDRLYEEWIGALDPRPLRFADFRPVLIPLAVVALALGAAFWWQRRLLRQLSEKTTRLREGEERLQRVLDGSEDGFWDWDIASGRIIRSERWAAMLGYTLAELESTVAAGTSLVHPDDLGAYETWRRHLTAPSNDRFDLEYRMRAKSGAWRWILDRGKVVDRAADGRPLRMAGTHTDITQRKLTEAALLERESQLRRAAQLLDQTQSAARLGGWESDLRSGLVQWTLETHRIHGTDPATFTPTREAVFGFCTPESRPRLVAAVNDAIREGTPYTVEVEIVNAQQRRLHVQIRAVAERDNGRVVKLNGFVRDITAERTADLERDQLKQKMLEAQKLESLGVLAGGIAHDFNNLLTVVLAHASVLREAAPGEKRLVHIETAAHRAADLCRQMLAYAGKGRFAIEPADLGAIVRDTADLVRVSISRKASLIVDIAPGLPPVEADVSQLRQIALNLVTNASEALGDAAGEVRVATRRARPDAMPGGMSLAFDLPPGDCVCLEVADTGAGMAPATLARIFDPFFTTKFAGRGLGLAAVLGIVRAHRGAITVESMPGAGTRFRVYFAASRKPAATAGPFAPAQSAAIAAGGAILVADDEPAVLETTSELLRLRGFETVLATDGNDAVRRFRATPQGFKAVLLDLTMPGLDGADALRAIRAENPAVPALVMSGFSEEAVIDRLQGLGQVGILHKPFTRELLIERVAAAAATAA
jgi:PAS domain S-box-containing protein